MHSCVAGLMILATISLADDNRHKSHLACAAGSEAVSASAIWHAASACVGADVGGAHKHVSRHTPTSIEILILPADHAAYMATGENAPSRRHRSSSHRRAAMKPRHASASSLSKRDICFDFMYRRPIAKPPPRGHENDDFHLQRNLRPGAAYNGAGHMRRPPLAVRHDACTRDYGREALGDNTPPDILPS